MKGVWAGGPDEIPAGDAKYLGPLQIKKQDKQGKDKRCLNTLKD
jgi:hypothetical protein